MLFTSCWSAIAAPPELKHLYPAAGQRGTNVAVKIGKTDAWPKGIWASTNGLRFTPTPIHGTWNVEIAADAPTGAHLIRTWNEEGASAPRFFLVSDHRETRSVEPNDDPATPQVIEELPAAISGRLDKNGDGDAYAVKLKKGQTLVSRVEAYVLASTFDGLLRITDAQGRVLAFNHDGRNLDPLLAWTAPHDGTFVIQLMGFAYPPQASVQLTGGEGCVYRLHLSTGPTARFSVPLAAQAGTHQSLRWIGWNLPLNPTDFDATQLHQGDVVREMKGMDLLQPISISGIPETLEAEPSAPEKPALMEVPSAITGRISHPGEVDRFRFTAVKNLAYQLKLTAAAAGSPLDAWIAIEGPDGKEVARNDDANSRDPELNWTAPADGNFTIAIGNLTRRGGEDHIYRLALTAAFPEVVATIASHSAIIAPGKNLEVKVTLKRTNGFNAKLQLHARDLPAGVTFKPADVPEKGGEITLVLTADASAASVGKIFTLYLKETESPREYPVRYNIATTSEDNGVPQGYTELAINNTDQLWLTVSPPHSK